MTKETPIIMSGNHPKLIIDGAKSMTRRTWGLEKINQNPDGWLLDSFNPKTGIAEFVMQGASDTFRVVIKCPYGQVGDRLWVRETFCEHTTGGVIYRADEEPSEGIYSYHTWRPSIHMPRWASRILLEITELRAERLQEITIEDCKKEGIEYLIYPKESRTWEGEFERLWDSLNAKRGYGWDMNPWDWPIGFKELQDG